MFKRIQTLAVIVLPLVLGGSSVAMAAAADPAPPTGGGPIAEGRHGGHDHPWDPAAHHKQACTAGYARRAAMFAYLDATLELTEQQKPLFAKWRQAALDVGTKEKASCLEMPAPKPEMHPSVVDRQSQMEKMLSMRLEAIKATHAPLQAFYESLTPAQRMILDRPHGGGEHGGREHGGWGHGGWGDGPAHGGDGHG